MQFLIIAYDGTDAEARNRRLAARGAHIELGDKLRDAGHLHFGTAILDEAGNMMGSMLVAEYESREELDAWLKVEPYVTGKVWVTIEVRPCRVGPSFERK